MLKFHMQVVLVYFQPFRCNLPLKYVLQPKNVKKITKTTFLEGSRSFKVIDVDKSKNAGRCSSCFAIRQYKSATDVKQPHGCWSVGWSHLPANRLVPRKQQCLFQPTRTNFVFCCQPRLINMPANLLHCAEGPALVQVCSHKS